MQGIGMPAVRVANMSKDLWFKEMERIYHEKLDAGIPDDKAYNDAAEEADSALTDRLADMIDYERMRRKYDKS